MRSPRLIFLQVSGSLCLLLFIACNNKGTGKNDAIANTPQQLQAKVTDIIRSYLDEALDNKGLLPDSTLLTQVRIVNLVYKSKDFNSFWCKEENWLPSGDSMHQFINNAKLFGLFPEDYHLNDLDPIRQKFFSDSLGKSDRKNAILWAKADMMLTDAFIRAIKDVKLGRLPKDSITLRKDSVLSDSFYLVQFDLLNQSSSVNTLMSSLEPKQRGYQMLKKGIQEFLDGAGNKEFTIVPPPGKDMANFRKALQKRLYEEGFITTDSVAVDSAQLAQAVKKFQEKKGITVDGKAGEGTVRMLNMSDREKFIRIAISMDKYKMLPEKMPSKYIWVNLPGFQMQLMVDDSVKISSKVICGKPKTRTPVLTSAVSELITYPQWVPPPSIIQKEILPAVKKNPGYLEKKGFSLLDSKGEEVDPFSVDWSQYSKAIPYRVVQGSGDANALGIMKFVFANKYSVYLHDTNQRYLFGQTNRSLSHGCVRVQEWEKLAFYLLRNDSIASGSRSSRSDSVKTWLQKKQKRSIALKSRMPVFIRYFTCEGTGNGIEFYDDIYGDDKMLREKYFATK
ncbi:MAG: L,D-transpeptidase family protein [Sphingobacteriales bacterium]|nr:L,D-transpeptidase family protein [Sphingobacteriales bacterium]